VLIPENIFELRQRISAAAARSGRNPESIQLVAVTKTVDTPEMAQALEAGLTAFGENRVQELTRKYDHFSDRVEWHLIGHLQTNKVKQVIGKTALIHSVDRLNLAREISNSAQAFGANVQVLIQVNVSGEDTKYGLAPVELEEFLQEVAGYPGLSVRGLMTMAPFVTDAEETRPVFRRLAELASQISRINVSGVEMRWLSMGMTNDFEVAIEEGANLVRIGNGIFGARK